MRKKSCSILIALCLLVSALALPAGAAFTDISDPDTAAAAAALQSMGIVTGVNDAETAFAPGRTLTRAEFSALAVRAMGLESSVKSNSYKAQFTDVKPGAWYTGYVNLAYQKGVISGYGNGEFGPNDNVTYGQVATILLRLLGYGSADVGKVWPADYVRYAAELELDKGLKLNAYSAVTRGDAALLLYHTLKTEMNGGTVPFYTTISGVASAETAIVMDVNAVSGGASGYLMACAVEGGAATVEYFSQKNRVPDSLTGALGELLLNSAGKVVGFVPDGGESTDLTISSAKSSSITDAAGRSHRIAGTARVIYNGSVYPYSSTGYLQVDAQTGRSARLYYDDDGGVRFVYIASGAAGAGTEAAVAQTNSAAAELARTLGISNSGYAITKNGAAATAADLARYDAAYFNPLTGTLCASDYRLAGHIEDAQPTVEAAERITVAGCTLEVLESAWSTLADCQLGGRVTLLLTDDGRVAAAYQNTAIAADMYGILSMDGTSVKLCGSGLVLAPSKITASEELRGTLVKVSAASKSTLSCAAPAAADSAGRLDLTAGTLGSRSVAPGCAIYETAGSGIRGYVYSLSGTAGAASSDFAEIRWTDSLPSAAVSFFHLNAAGQVDILLLKDVTGNCYEYGKLRLYTDTEGINFNPGATMSAYNTAATLTNIVTPGQSAKYLCTLSADSMDYTGISLGTQSSAYQRVCAISRLTASAKLDKSGFFKEGDDWFVTVGGYEIPVSDRVQLHFTGTDRWLSGEDGLLSALSSGMQLTVWYDRTLTTGAQARVIVVRAA